MPYIWYGCILKNIFYFSYLLMHNSLTESFIDLKQTATVDPWTQWVWTAQFHLKADIIFFLVVNTEVQDLWLVESIDREPHMHRGTMCTESQLKVIGEFSISQWVITPDLGVESSVLSMFYWWRHLKKKTCQPWCYDI